MLVAEAHEGDDGVDRIAAPRGIMWVAEHHSADFDAGFGSRVESGFELVDTRWRKLVGSMKWNVVEVDP